MESSFSKEIPSHIGVYQVIEKIAEGGFGVVYKAFDPRLKRDVAIKVLHPQHSTEPTRIARFLREAQSAAKINHPNIVQIYDIVEEGGKLALVMEFVNGESLDKFLKDFPNLLLIERLHIAIQIAEALCVAHELGIIHRDIKPANILIDEHLNVKLTDFNLARLLDTSLTPLTGDHNVLGTPAYMSPEQCQGKEATAQSDIYSLGVVMYYLFTGTLPFEGNNYLALMRHHLETPPTPVRIINPNLPISLEKLITQCLAKSPENRPNSAKEIAENLKKIAEEISKKSGQVEPLDQPTVVLKDTTPQIESASPPTPAVSHTPYQGFPSPSPTPLTSQSSPVQESYHVPPPYPPTPQQTPYQTPITPQQYTYTQYQSSQTPIPPSTHTPSLSETRKWETISGKTSLIIFILLILTLISTSVSIYLAYKLSTQPTTKITEYTVDRSPSNSYQVLPTEKNIESKRIETSKILISYAKEVDRNYNYRLHSTSKGAGYNAYFLELVSQSWHPEKTLPPLWRHWLTLVVPDRRTKDSALLILTKGLSSPEKPMSEIPLLLVSIAISTNSIVAILEGFPLDPTGVYETPSKKVDLKEIDFFIWSLKQYFDTNDPTWIPFLPLVKSVVGGINATQEFILKDLKSEIPVKEFVLYADTPLFTCWLVPAVDERVIALAGINNFTYNIETLIKTFLMNEIPLPTFFEEIDNEGLLQLFETKEGEKLLSIIDPYYYRQFLKIPKLVVSYNGFSFSNFSSLAETVISEMPEPIHWVLTPHLSLTREPLFLSQTLTMLSSKLAVPPKIYDFRDTLHVFYHRIINRKEFPHFLWNITDEGKCSAKISEEVVEARAWFCVQDSKNSLLLNPSEWQVELMTEIAEGTYEVNLNLPKEFYKAIFIEVIFPSLSGTNFPVTSPIHIISPQSSNK